MNVWKLFENLLIWICCLMFYNRPTSAANGSSNAPSNVQANGNTSRVSAPQSMTEIQTANHSQVITLPNDEIILEIETGLQIWCAVITIIMPWCHFHSFTLSRKLLQCGTIAKQSYCTFGIFIRSVIDHYDNCAYFICFSANRTKVSAGYHSNWTKVFTRNIRPKFFYAVCWFIGDVSSNILLITQSEMFPGI